jgi:hypothetical protein
MYQRRSPLLMLAPTLLRLLVGFTHQRRVRIVSGFLAELLSTEPYTPSHAILPAAPKSLSRKSIGTVLNLLAILSGVRRSLRLLRHHRYRGRRANRHLLVQPSHDRLQQVKRRLLLC